MLDAFGLNRVSLPATDSRALHLVSTASVTLMTLLFRCRAACGKEFGVLDMSSILGSCCWIQILEAGASEESGGVAG